MIIFSPEGNPFLNVEVDDSSYRYRALMGEDRLILEFSLTTHIDFPVGCYAMYRNVRYELLTPSSVSVIHRRAFEYQLTMDAAWGRMGRYKVHNMVDGRLKFDLTETPQRHLEQLVQNLNERDGDGVWAVGACITESEKLISYNHMSCDGALAQIATAFDTEWEIVVTSTGSGQNHYTINLGKVEHFKESPLALSYGKDRGFISGVRRTNDADADALPVGTVYVQGGERNIDYSNYPTSDIHSATLLLPRGVTVNFDGEHLEGDDEYDPSGTIMTFKTDDKGYSVRRVSSSGTDFHEHKNEASLDLSEVYPMREGVVTNVRYVYNSNSYTYDEITALAGVDWDKVNVDIIDSTIPDDLDYDQYLIKGEKMTVIFQSGMLSGREFDVKKYYSASVYDRMAKRFELVAAEIDGVRMPNRTFRPQSREERGEGNEGDRYAVFHCALPQSYITEAERTMLRKACKYIYERQQFKFSFIGELDGLWSKRHWASVGGQLVVGGYVNFVDESIAADGVKVRITGIKDYVNDPYAPQIELSTTTSPASLSSTIRQMKGESAHAEALNKQTEEYTRRSFKQAQETAQMLENAIEGFTDGINPVTVRTMQLLVGNDNLQFRFVRGWNDMREADPYPVSYSPESKTVKAVATYIQHMTMGIDSITSDGVRTAADYYRWSMPAWESAVLSDELASKPYYLYAKVPTSPNRAGEWVLSENPQAFEQTDDAGRHHYYLLAGIYSSEMDGTRSFARTHGFTEVLPGQITTERIISSDANSFFDLANGKFQIGDGDKTYVKWNVEAGRLEISGAWNVTGSDNAYPTLDPRGEWSSAATYNLGDLVVYKGTQYFWNSNTSGSGVEPPAAQWTVYQNAARGIESTETKYGRSKNGTTYPTEWKDTPEEVVLEDDYVWFWTKTTITYSDSSTPYIYYSKVRKGENGEDGEDGDDGTDGDSYFKSIVFTRTNSTPSRPNGGTFASPLPTDKDTSGKLIWSDGVPPGEAMLWMSTRIFCSDATKSAATWTEPSQATDTADLDIEYNNNDDYGAAPQKSKPTDVVPAGGDANGWYDASDATMDITKAQWMATRKIKNGEYSGEWDILHVKGEKGEDGEDGTNYSTYFEYARRILAGNPAAGEWGTKAFSDSEMEGYYVWERQCVYIDDVKKVLDGTVEFPQGSGLKPNTVVLIHDPSSGVESQTRDNVAKTLGYGSWKEFEEKVKSGSVIIEGGMIRADLINVTALIADLFQTGMSGERVVIKKDSIEIKNESDVTALFMDGGKEYYDLSDFTYLSGATVTRAIPSATQAASVHVIPGENVYGFVTATPVAFGSFSIDKPSRLTVAYPPSLTLSRGSLASLESISATNGITVNLYVLNQDTGARTLISSGTFTSLNDGTQTMPGTMTTVSLSKGSYAFVLDVGAGAEVVYTYKGTDVANLDVTLGVAGSGSYTIEELTNSTEIFKNGFGYKSDEYNYHGTVLSQATGKIEWGVSSGSAVASYGIKVLSTGIFINLGAGWKQLSTATISGSTVLKLT